MYFRRDEKKNKYLNAADLSFKEGNDFKLK